MRQVFKRAATQWRNQVDELAVTRMDHVLKELCKRDKEDDGAGPSTGGSVV